MIVVVVRAYCLSYCSCVLYCILYFALHLCCKYCPYSYCRDDDSDSEGSDIKDIMNELNALAEPLISTNNLEHSISIDDVYTQVTQCTDINTLRRLVTVCIHRS